MSDDLFAKLAAPFDPQSIDWRVGSTTADKAKGLALCYIDARVVMERLDAACGPGGWQCRYSHVGPTTVCEISLRIDGEWLTKADGAGATDVEAEKGMLSDSFKRAAVRWGIGRYLYDIASPWVALKAQGKSYVIDESEIPRLHKLLGGSATAIHSTNSSAKAPPPKREITPLEWCNASKSAIDTFRTPAELEAWEKKNRAAIEKLHTMESDLAEDMETFIGLKWKKLTREAA